ncbi:beta-class carbonic anhydrase [Salirhabdus salicampi]|uniref:beta-class carbonic anhydrase n=1 Tax=Salirhabdus salicampi TaxID=476102 RepID=UPI0020C58324|nr:carbonic anhydrase [Salirhabdus salicampi]MCP8615314.1 carbonic anhydrase [Salirhabdus salicampi]
MLLYDVLEHNKSFVENKQYEPFETDKLPNKKVVVLSCMDTRLVELLPNATNLKNGDMKIVKNAGAIIPNEHDSVVKSILVAIYALQAEEVMIIGHHRCGMSQVNANDFKEALLEKGITEDQISGFEQQVPLDGWMVGFDQVEQSVANSASILRKHPLLPEGIPVHGLVIDPHTGKLDLVVDGYEK